MRDARALVEFQPARERLLDRDAALEEPGSDLECPGLGHRDSRDRAREELVYAGLFRVPEGGSSARECGPHIALEQAYPAQVDEDLRRASVVVARLRERALAPSSQRREVGAAHAGEREEHVGTLLSRRCLGQQFVQDSAGPVAVACEAMCLGGGEASAPSCRRIGWRRQSCGYLVELRSRGRCASVERVQRRRIERRGDGLVRPVGGERQVTRTLLVVVREGGDARVRLATLPRRCALVAGRREEGMYEAHTLRVELDNSCPGSLLECLENLGLLAVRSHQCLDRGPGERRNEEQNVTAGRRKPS